MHGLIRLYSRLRAVRRDGGEALLLALIVVTVIGIVLGAVISYAGTGLLITPQVRNDRNVSYYVQGGVDAAINQIRTSSVSGSTTTGAPCSSTNPYTYVPPAPTASGANADQGADTYQYKVLCNSIASSSEPGSDVPLWAVQTLGTAAGDGVNQSSSSNGTLHIDGGIASSNIVSNKGTGQALMFVNGSVYAKHACTGNIKNTDSAGLQCNYTGPVPITTDPQYPPAVTSATTLASSTGADPAITCHSGVAWFSPGYYSVQPQTDLTYWASQAGATCKGTETTWWFQPGFYYFDFAANDPNGNTWDISRNLAIVGGTPPTGTTWTTGGTLTPGKGCDTTADTTDPNEPKYPGVQFIFGGASNMSLSQHNIDFELCGPNQAQVGTGNGNGAPATKQSIALYGLNGNANQQAKTSRTDTATVTTGSSAVLDTSVVAADAGRPVSGTGVPTGAFVGWGINAPVGGVSFKLVDATDSPVNATAGSSSVTLAAVTAQSCNWADAGKQCQASSDPTNTTSTHFSSPLSNARYIGDAKTASVLLASQGSAGLSYAGFNSIGAPGAHINSIGICLTTVPDAHATESVQVTSPEGSKTYTTFISPPPSCPTGTTKYVAIPSADQTTLLSSPQWIDLSKMSVTYTVKEAKNQTGTSTVDGIALATTWTPPTLETLTPIDEYLLATANSPQVTTWMHSTVYAPSAGLDMEAQSSSTVIFQRGVVLSNLLTNDIASFTQTTPLFSLPGVVTTRFVQFTGEVNNGPGGAYEPAVIACVHYSDNNFFPGYSLTVTHWTVLRSPTQSGPACS